MNKRFGLVNLSSGGFFSNFFSSLSTAMDSEKNGLIPYIVLDRTIFAEYSDVKGVNTFNWWFDQQIPDSDDLVINIPNNLDNINQATRLWQREDVPSIRYFFNKYFKVKDHIKESVELFYEEKLKCKITVSVMARGTEYTKMHAHYGNHTVYSFIDSVKKVIEEHPEVNNVFLVTEDNDWVEAFKNEFSNLTYMDVFRKTDQPIEAWENRTEWAYENPRRANHTRILGEECLTQALLLGKCDYFVCKQCGTSSAGILFNENFKNVYYV